MSKHTAGEWRIGRSTEQVFANGSIVADCMWIDRPTNECIANASLIAAAPELLEACKEALKARLITHYGDDPLLSMLHFAIQKAEVAP
jgi:hypothetical protein